VVGSEQALRAVFEGGRDPADHPFVRKYASASVLTLGIAEGVVATLPLGREVVGLTLAELYQATDRVGQAISVVEQMEPTFSAAISLAELYSEAGQHDQVIELTNGLANESDEHAFLLIMRARALRNEGMLDGAREVLKEALRRRSVNADIKNLAYFERAHTYFAQGRKAQARKDLERIYAERSDYPGLTELMRELQGGH
jgi:tetratricopeptide (TPR) repeat protein